MGGEGSLDYLAFLLLGLGAVVWATRLALDNAVKIARHYRLCLLYTSDAADD